MYKPLYRFPEVADYQVLIREKKQKERESRESVRDLTKYDVTIADKHHSGQSKRWMMFQLVSAVLANGGTAQQVMEAIPWRKNRLFEVFEGNLSVEEVYDQLMRDDVGGKVPRAKRYFCNDGELFHADARTYVLSNQWGDRTREAADSLAEVFPHLKIEIKPSDSV